MMILGNNYKSLSVSFFSYGRIWVIDKRFDMILMISTNVLNRFIKKERKYEKIINFNNDFNLFNSLS